MTVPAQIHDQKYISLASFRKNGTEVRTPLWFVEDGDKIYFMTRNDSWKYKRIRTNSSVKVAPCTVRGKVTGPDFPGRAAVLPREQWPAAKRLLHKKYWLARFGIWSSKNEFLVVELDG